MDNIKKHLLLITVICTCWFAPGVAQEQLTNLPTLYITTQNSEPVVNKTNYVPGNIIIKSQEPTEELSAVTGIRLRGNSTFRMDKKPFRIKLEDKTNILNLPAKVRSWVLLANHADKTLIRNAVAMEVSNLLGFEFTPSVRFVDVVLNGSFLGNYMLTDQIQVKKGRVSIVEQVAADVELPYITGGYLIEQAGDPTDEPVWFLSGKEMKLVIKSPDSDIINSAQINYIKNYIADFEHCLFSVDFADPVKGYRSMVDETSLINWYIACELTTNPDSFWSIYFYKDRFDDKIYFGPLWDYDIAFNNDNRLGDTTYKHMREVAWDPKAWIERLWKDDWFRATVWERWQQLTAAGLENSLLTYIDKTSQLIDESQQLNFTRWDVLNTPVYLETYLFDTYKEGIDYLKTYVSKRIGFLTESFSKYEPDKPSVPFVPSENDYYAIRNKRSGNLITVDQHSVQQDAKLVFWETQEDNDAQSWQIIQLGEELFQIINKNSGLAMAGNGFSNNLTQVPVNPVDPLQQWSIIPVNTGNIYGIVNKHSGYSVNNSYGSMENGTPVIEYNNNIAGSENQQFYIESRSGSTGISGSENLISQATIYPNPATDQIQIEMTIGKPQQVIITITDLRGVQKYQMINYLSDSGDSNITIPLANFDPGLYLVTISNTKGEKHVRKLTVIR